MQALCRQLGVTGLRAQLDANAWSDVTFVGDIDVSRLKGYADRFFDLESGLLKIFHRRVRLIDEESFREQQNRCTGELKAVEDIELLHAS